MTKNEIIEAIKVTAEANGGVPLGRSRFVKETGITEKQYLKFGTLGQLQEEAGYNPNTLQEAVEESELIKQLIELCCRFGSFPTIQKLTQVRYEEPLKFSSPNTFNRLGRTKSLRAAKIIDALSLKDKLNSEEQRALNICLPVANVADTDPDEPEGKLLGCGYVYLFRDGKAYKIGNSTDPESRRDALQTGNPRKISLVHRILTDDPKGIEDYWHRRFSNLRIRITEGHEWFNLSREDVAAFKARNRM